MQTNVIDLTASTTSLPAHGLNEEQLAKLQPVIDLVETQLLHCVDDIRQARWKTDSRLKTRAELNLRQLVLRLGTLLKVEPLTDEQRKLRTDLLTRRIRCFTRVFSLGPRKYFQGAIPDIDWNEELIPKELYPEDDLIAAREERDFAQEEEEMREDLRKAKERMEERTKGDRVKARRENAERAKAMLEVIAKRELKTMRKEEAKEQKRKREEEHESKEEEQEEEEERKGKDDDEEEERARKEGEEREERKRKEEEEQEEKTRKEREKKERKRKEEEERKRKEEDGRRKTAVVAPSQAPRTKKRSRKEVKSKETIEDSDEVAQTDGPNTVRAAKKQKKQKTIPDPVDTDLCERCHRLEFECISNGPRRACDTCRLAKKTCSMAEKGQSGGLPPTKPQARQKPTAAPEQRPPPPPVLNPPAAPLSHQMAQAKRKRGVTDAGEAGPSKIRKVHIMVPLPKETISVKEEEANPVKMPTVRVLRVGVKPESRKVTPSAEGEKLVVQGGDSDVTSIILRRLEDQDKRIRELEASESVMGKSVVKSIIKKTYVDDVLADAIHTMEQQTQDLDFEQRETRKRLDALVDNGVNVLTQRFQDLETKFDKVDLLDKKIVRLAGGFDQEERRRDEEDKRREEEEKRRDKALEAMELRWADEVIRVETNLEEQFQERDRKLVEWQSMTVSDLNSQVEESLKRLQNELQQDWWTAELDRRAKVQTEEMKMLLNHRPTLEEIGGLFTTLGTTSRLIGQVGDLHAKTARDNHLLQSELHTLERLYLRQLDSSAPLVNASQQLQEMLHRQILHSPTSHPPPPPIVQTNNFPPPQPQAPIQRAMSGPPTFPSGSRVHPELPKEMLRADVTMDDESGNKGLEEVKGGHGDDESMGLGLGIVSHVSSMSPSHDPQSPSPIRTRSRTLAMQRAASAAPLSPPHSALLCPLQEETLASSPLTTCSDMGTSPAKSTSGNTDRIMSEYINFDMTS